MVNTLDMKDIRYLNLFNKVTRVPTRFCFKYNEVIVFSVPRPLVSKAIGENGRNVKKISEITGKKIKIIANPQGIFDAKIFIQSVVNPVTFNKLETTENEIIITAGSQNKAALIGRNRRRILELQKITKDFFKRNLRVV